MPAGPAGLGMEGGQPQASRKEALPGCRAGPRQEWRTQRLEVSKEPAFVDGQRACLRGRPKEPGEAVERAVVGNMRPEAYLGAEKGRLDGGPERRASGLHWARRPQQGTPRNRG